jgi:hypothetical protein
MECCAEIQQCNIDNKEFTRRKLKYETGSSQPPIKGQPQQQERVLTAQDEAVYVARIEELKEEITKKIKIIKELQNQRRN